MDYSQIITVEAGKRSGQPCVRGMRITVRDVLEYLALLQARATDVRAFLGDPSAALLELP